MYHFSKIHLNLHIQRGLRPKLFGILDNLERYLISIYVVDFFLSHMVYSTSAQEQGSDLVCVKVGRIVHKGSLWPL